MKAEVVIKLSNKKLEIDKFKQLLLELLGDKDLKITIIGKLDNTKVVLKNNIIQPLGIRI